MKKIIFLLLFVPFISFANGPEISSLKTNNETSYITYVAEKGESLNDIAKKFSLKTTTLLKFNNMTMNSVVKTYQTILIPLTETNYFKLKGINASSGYLPIYFVIEEAKTKVEICTQLGLLVESFDKWNKSEYIDNLIIGEKVIVGWLKLGSTPIEEEVIAMPTKTIRKETIKPEVVKSEPKIKPTEQELTSKKAGNYIAEIKKKDVSIEEIKGDNTKKSIFKKKKINSIDETDLNVDEENSSSDTVKKISFKEKFNSIFKNGGYKPYEKKATSTPVQTNKNLVVTQKKVQPTYTQPIKTTTPKVKPAVVKTTKEPFSFKKIFKKSSYEPYQRRTTQPTTKPQIIVKKKEVETPTESKSEVVNTTKEPFSFKKLFKKSSYEPYQKRDVKLAPKPVVKMVPKKQIEEPVVYETKEEIIDEKPIAKTKKAEPKHFFTKIKNAFKSGGYEPYNKNNNVKVTTPVAPKPIVKTTPTTTNNYKPLVRKTVEVPRKVIEKPTPKVEAKIEPKEEKVVVKTTPKVKAIKPIKEEKVVVIEKPTTEKNDIFTRIKKSFSASDDNLKPVVKTNIPVKKEIKTTNPVVKENTVVAENEEIIESDNTIRNEIKPLSLNNSKNGKAAMFYSGPKGGKFYVVSNIAPKGEIVKVTNTSNGKFVMAEVLSSLPSADISKGLLIKLSDNAKLPLGVSNSTFFVKVNY